MPAELAFEPREGTWLAVRRLALGELWVAQAALGDPSQDPYVVVHETRKAIKRLRALLRLVEKPLRKSFRKLNRELAVVAKSLAHLRESAAALEAIDELATRAAAHEQARFAQARATFIEREPRRLLVVRALLLAARSNLLQIQERIEAWKELRSDFALIERGFRVSYKRARRRLAVAREETSTEALHDFRKALKVHLYQVQYLRPAWPGALGERALLLAELGKSLGEHHDLALLIGDLRERGFDDLAARASARNTHLELEILTLAERCFQQRARHLSAELARNFECFFRSPDA